MASVITVDVESIKNATDCNLHFLPCEINFSGHAKVQEYFSSSMRNDVNESNVLTATFRGRPLDGELKQVPSGYTGIVLKETRKAYTDEEERHLTAAQKFSQFYYWNLDKKPSPDEKLQQAIDWLEIAKVVILNAAMFYGFCDFLNLCQEYTVIRNATILVYIVYLYD